MKTKLIEIKPGVHLDPLTIIEIQAIMPNEEFKFPHRVAVKTRTNGFVIDCEDRDSAISKSESIANQVNECNAQNE